MAGDLPLGASGSAFGSAGIVGDPPIGAAGGTAIGLIGLGGVADGDGIAGTGFAESVPPVGVTEGEAGDSLPTAGMTVPGGGGAIVADGVLPWPASADLSPCSFPAETFPGGGIGDPENVPASLKSPDPSTGGTIIELDDTGCVPLPLEPGGLDADDPPGGEMGDTVTPVVPDPEPVDGATSTDGGGIALLGLVGLCLSGEDTGVSSGVLGSTVGTVGISGRTIPDPDRSRDSPIVGLFPGDRGSAELALISPIHAERDEDS